MKIGHNALSRFIPKPDESTPAVELISIVIVPSLPRLTPSPVVTGVAGAGFAAAPPAIDPPPIYCKSNGTSLAATCSKANDGSLSLSSKILKISGYLNIYLKPDLNSVTKITTL